MGGYRQLPGARLEIIETPHAVIRRKIAEGLGIEVLSTNRFGSVRIGRRRVLVVRRVRHLVGAFRRNTSEFDAMRALRPDGFRAGEPALAANDAVLRLLGV